MSLLEGVRFDSSPDHLDEPVGSSFTDLDVETVWQRIRESNLHRISFVELAAFFGADPARDSLPRIDVSAYESLTANDIDKFVRVLGEFVDGEPGLFRLEDVDVNGPLVWFIAFDPLAPDVDETIRYWFHDSRGWVSYRDGPASERRRLSEVAWRMLIAALALTRSARLGSAVLGVKRVSRQAAEVYLKMSGPIVSGPKSDWRSHDRPAP